MRRYLRLAPIFGGVLLWAWLAIGVDATSMALGEAWVGGNPPSQDLAAYGGSLYLDYGSAPNADGNPNRVRLLRYPSQSVTAAQVAALTSKGLHWGLGNENNNGGPYGQDGALTTDAAAAQYVVWFHDNALAIRTGDPTAKILGPSVTGWTYYNTPPETVAGLYAYNRFLSAYATRYGTVPPMDVLAFHFYPLRYELIPVTDSELSEQFNMAADYASAHGWQIAVTEWGHWSQYFVPGCPPVGQSEASRYSYTLHGLQTFANRGALMALYFANVPQGCDSNGHASSLFTAGGVLNPEGRAHRDFVQGVVPPTATSLPTATPAPSFTSTRTATAMPLPSATATRVPTATATPTPTPTSQSTPTATLSATPSPTSTITPTLAATGTASETPLPTLTPTRSPTPCGSILQHCTATPTFTVTRTASPTRTPCFWTFIHRCP